jgi:hypothetical protein
MESRGNILLRLRSGGVLFVEGGIGTKIPSEYFAGTGIGIGMGFCRIGDDRNRGEKIRFCRTLFLTIIQFLTDIESRPGPGPGPELKKILTGTGNGTKTF